MIGGRLLVRGRGRRRRHRLRVGRQDDLQHDRRPQYHRGRRRGRGRVEGGAASTLLLLLNAADGVGGQVDELKRGGGSDSERIRVKEFKTSNEICVNTTYCGDCCKNSSASGVELTDKEDGFAFHDREETARVIVHNICYEWQCVRH